MPTAERNFLLSTRWLSEFSEQTAEAILEACHIKEFKNGDTVQKKGKKGDGIYVLLSGAVRFSAVSAAGTEVSFGYLRPGEWAGVISSIDGGGRTHDAYAVGPTRMAWLGVTSITQLSAKYDDFYRVLIKMLCCSIRDTIDEFDKMLMFSTEQILAWRIAYFFEMDQSNVSIPLRQDDLAALVGVSRQTINRILQRWSTEGLVETNYGNIRVLDLKRMQRIYE